MLDTLSEREAGVVSMRFGLTDGQPKTLDEIGKVYGVTRERIRQIESKTMSKLRHPSLARCCGTTWTERPDARTVPTQVRGGLGVAYSIGDGRTDDPWLGIVTRGQGILATVFLNAAHRTVALLTDQKTAHPGTGGVADGCPAP